MTDKNVLIQHYTKLICETAAGVQKVVCEKNGISLTPTSGAQICPIPVYEQDAKFTLLENANIRRTATTIIHWATNTNYTYLPAYIKKYKRDGKRYNEIIITTNNYCEARFFAAKELMHCFVDDDGHHATNSIEAVNELIESLSIGLSSLSEATPQTIVDEIAWLGAAEYLVPNSWIPLLASMYQQLVSLDPPVNAYLHLAQKIRVPENVLRARLRNARPFTIT
jgi:Zn-dependent peptidase ImmA (M78 family)